MEIGISTASLFSRFYTEDALKFLSDNKIKSAEVFLASYCEYNKEFGQLLKSVNQNTNVHSVHVLNTQYEPQLYSLNKRAQEDSFKILKGTMEAAKEIGAKYYTFHGTARLKKTPVIIDYDMIGNVTQRIIDEIKPYGVSLAYENVHWCYYNYIGFFTEVKKRTVGLKGTFDVKQARQGEIFYGEFIKEMGEDIVTVHLSDVDAKGKMCLPGRGITNFTDIFKRLKDVGFNGAMLLEVYPGDYKDFKELFDSLDFVKETADKIFQY